MGKTIYCLIKVYKEEDEAHANAFLERGEMYCKTLKAFKEIEDNDIRGDGLEGLSHYFQPEGLVITLSLNKPIAGIPDEFYIKESDLAAPVLVHSSKYDFYNLFCMYAISIDDFEYTYNTPEDKEHLKEKIRYQLNEQIKVDPKILELGKFAIVIFGVEKFISRVNKYAQDFNFQPHHGLVGYYGESGFSGSFNGVESIFRKRNGYGWQKEYRFALNTSNTDNESKVLNIGALTDVGIKITVSELTNIFEMKIDD